MYASIKGGSKERSGHKDLINYEWGQEDGFPEDSLNPPTMHGLCALRWALLGLPQKGMLAPTALYPLRQCFSASQPPQPFCRVSHVVVTPPYNHFRYCFIIVILLPL